jgi:hypothetical protein
VSGRLAMATASQGRSLRGPRPILVREDNTCPWISRQSRTEQIAVLVPSVMVSRQTSLLKTGLREWPDTAPPEAESKWRRADSNRRPPACKTRPLSIAHLRKRRTASSGGIS